MQHTTLSNRLDYWTSDRPVLSNREYVTFLIVYCELVNIIKYGSYECDDEDVETSVIETQRLLKLSLRCRSTRTGQ